MDECGTTWTRRGVIAAAAGAAAAAALPALPAVAGAAAEDALRAYARDVGAAPGIAALGLAAAADRDAGAIEAALRARLPGPRDRAAWQAGLCQAARADIAAGAWVEVAGTRLTRVEADFLALAGRLRAAA